MSLGGNVRKGEHGTTIVYADRFIPDEERKRAERDDDEPGAIPFLKRFTVFNTDQCENLPGELVTAPPPVPEGLSPRPAPISASAATGPFTAPRRIIITGRDGLPCRVWRNPNRQEFATALRSSAADANGLRGLLTLSDLYVWQSTNLLHPDFERETRIEGMRIALRASEVRTNHESVALPEQSRWVFPDLAQVATMDIEDRRKLVADHLQRNERLKRVYPAGFTVVWYS